ncbi:hypothetical protein E2C01_065152 [Portunus trituberculatus]|uniref:Uncharacterized protein n=1 Tax=Portunus trituberculatus TaxID=210409 RepID=A0A5B7HEX1_PORTR|nr:hypothetical protein [Portunus trituberculatus]
MITRRQQDSDNPGQARTTPLLHMNRKEGGDRIQTAAWRRSQERERNDAGGVGDYGPSVDDNRVNLFRKYNRTTLQRGEEREIGREAVGWRGVEGSEGELGIGRRREGGMEGEGDTFMKKS